MLPLLVGGYITVGAWGFLFDCDMRRARAWEYARAPSAIARSATMKITREYILGKRRIGWWEVSDARDTLDWIADSRAVSADSRRSAFSHREYPNTLCSDTVLSVVCAIEAHTCLLSGTKRAQESGLPIVACVLAKVDQNAQPRNAVQRNGANGPTGGREGGGLKGAAVLALGMPSTPVARPFSVFVCLLLYRSLFDTLYRSFVRASRSFSPRTCASASAAALRSPADPLPPPPMSGATSA
jgi:hypothetical protein